MGTFFTDEQMQEAIAALEDHTPGIWERMKKMVLIPDDPHKKDKKQSREPSCACLLSFCPKCRSLRKLRTHSRQGYA